MRRTLRRAGIALAALLVTLSLAPAGAAAGGQQRARYIVVLQDDVRYPAAIAKRQAGPSGPGRAHRLPRSSCSRSMASNSSLKFPRPNPREPWRSISS
jgi:hypothetical protein